MEEEVEGEKSDKGRKGGIVRKNRGGTQEEKGKEDTKKRERLRKER